MFVKDVFFGRWDILDKNDISGVMHGAAMYPRINRLPSKHDIHDLNRRAPWIDDKMDKVFKSYKKHFCEFILAT